MPAPIGLLFQARPSKVDLDSIDAERHPGVLGWVDQNVWRDKMDAHSILWMRGYRRFGDVFERATQLSANSPETKLADPWYLVGLREEDFTPATRSYVARTFGSGASSSSFVQFVNTFHKRGNLPDNFGEQVNWAGGRAIPQTTIWSSWVMGVLGTYARTWKPEDIDELMAAGVKRRDVDHTLSALYGVTDGETRNINRQVLPDVPYDAVRAILIEGVPLEYAQVAFA